MSAKHSKTERKGDSFFDVALSLFRILECMESWAILEAGRALSFLFFLDFPNRMREEP